MSRFKGLVVGILAGVLCANLSQAAVKLLTETEYGYGATTSGNISTTTTSLSTPTTASTVSTASTSSTTSTTTSASGANSANSSTSADPLTAISSDDETCSYEACPAAYTAQTVECKYKNSAAERSCTQTSCCNGDTVVTVSECPSALTYRVSSLDGISNADTMEYCEGYRNGIYGFYFYANPNTCNAKGIDGQSSEYKTVSEWCNNTKYSADANCLSVAQGAGESCIDTASSNQILYSSIVCNSTFVSRDVWCENNSASVDVAVCKSDYIGTGTPCKLDATDMSDSSQWKYNSYSVSCPTTTKRTIADTANECVVSGESIAYYETCQSYNATTLKYETKYMCKCPPAYGTECDDASLVRGGQLCQFDLDSDGQKILDKYASCRLACGSDYASQYASETFGCDGIDSYSSSVRGGGSDPQMCVLGTTHSEQYICACPSNFSTLEDWCAANYTKEGLSSVAECTSSYKGHGTVCTRDVATGVSGTPTKVLTKYAYYVRPCPTGRSLFNSEDDCPYVGGNYAFTCLDSSAKDRVVCSCPTTWHSTDSTSSGCAKTKINEVTFDTEPSGDVCNLDGDTSPKYQDCTPLCSDMLSQLAKPNAYVYLSSVSGEPTAENCQDTLGKGAVLGYGNQEACSSDHSKMYPCYCPSSMVECSTENGELPAEGAKTCEANGKIYYSACQIVSCPNESSTVAIVTEQTSGNIAQEVATVYGSGATFVQCQQGDSIKYKVTCDSSTYTEICDYPLTAPKNGSWCRYGSTDDILMKHGTMHYATDSCRVRTTLAECGKTVVDDTDASYTIFVASSEEECRTKYGPGISVQLCEYGEDKGSQHAYNCYYNPEEFKFTTANCGVRHDLSGNYIMIAGKKYWRDCKCSSAYKYHKYNCSGMMSGNVCQQELTQSIIDSDSSLTAAAEDGVTLLGKKLAYYPYCQCSADYTEVCDEDGSGRYQGVGEACNGKYKSCACVPDAVPDNWADNYYGCPGGKKPTGVWKDNGCGKKYYQCEVVACTWEYTETCVAPSVPVGSSCQDNEGNNGGYKACTCPSGYKICPENQVGEGEPCVVSGVSYYTSCKEPENCKYVANELCTDPLQVGVNPCTKDNMTYYERCTCAQGYNVTCKEGEVGIGAACEIDGVKYYQSCAKPSTTCTSAHVSACDTNQQSYSPCTETNAKGEAVVKYLCKCPSNWFTASTCTDGTLAGEVCTQQTSGSSATTYYSECTSATACTGYQEVSYSVCNESQKGEGGSCLSTAADGTTVTKYAQCTDSRNCYATGFRYSCTGYDESALGESCIDANGNKLYRSCPCPTNYIECSGNNAVKGAKCQPVNEDGSYDTPVYSSCTCDTGKYKYTCAAETSGNQGIVPPANASYCEAATLVTSTDSDGNKVVTTENVKYYSYCECDSAYQYTCAEGSNGAKLPDGYGADYCQINNTKFYKGCDCASTYTVTAAECAANAGQTTSGEGCTVRGVVARSTTDSDGNTTTTTITPDTYYQGCVCKSNYILDCDYDENADSYDQSSIAACVIGTNHPLYPKCQCKTTEHKACVSDAKNTGITTGEECSQKTVDESGNIKTETYATSCTCKAAFGIEESVCQDDMYDQSSEEYCLTGEKDSNGKVEPKYYKACVCNSSVYDNSIVLETNNATTYCNSLKAKVKPTIENQFCGQKTWNATLQKVVETYHPNKNLCCTPTVVSGWTLYSSTDTYSDLQDFKDKEMNNAMNSFTNVCGHAYNAQVQIDCDGTAYYICDNTTISTGVASGTSYHAEGQCKSPLVDSGEQKISSSAWLGSLTLYSSCACSSEYKFTCEGYDQSDVKDYCQIDGNPQQYYKQCVCTNGTANESCTTEDALNQVTATTVCTSKALDTNGTLVETPYNICTCDAKYQYTCEGDEYDQDGQAYCQIDGGTKYYASCQCDSDVYDTATTSSTNDATTYCAKDEKKVKLTITGKQFCEQQSGIYIPNQQLCCESTVVSGWTLYSSTDIYNDLQDFKNKEMNNAMNFFTNVCGHAYNAQVQIDCDGKAYYICDNSDIRDGAKSNIIYSAAGQCKSPMVDSGEQDISSSAWLGALTLYSSCTCSSEYQFTCEGDAYTPADLSSCTVDGVAKYTACQCATGYNLTCTGTEYDQDGQDYCQLDDKPTYYARCICDSSVYDNTITSSTTDAETYCAGLTTETETYKLLPTTTSPFCTQKIWNDTLKRVEDTYRPNKNLCCKSTVDSDWKEYSSTTTYHDLYDFKMHEEDKAQATFKTECGHAYNAQVKIDCDGTAYYQCINETIAKNATKPWAEVGNCNSTETEDTTTAQTISGSWWSDDVITVYSACICKPQYQLPCEGDEYDQTGREYCSIGGIKKYDRCVCKSGTPKICTSASDSLNKVITTTVCVEQAVSSDGRIGPLLEYHTCTCDAKYKFTCDKTNNQDGQEYCQIDGGTKYYASCICDSSVYDTTKTSSTTNAETYCAGLTTEAVTYRVVKNTLPQFCPEQSDSSDLTDYILRPNKNLCCSDSLMANIYTVYDEDNTYTDIADFRDKEKDNAGSFFDTACKGEYNAQVAIGCDGRAYYKCSGDDWPVITEEDDTLHTSGWCDQTYSGEYEKWLDTDCEEVNYWNGKVELCKGCVQEE